MIDAALAKDPMLRMLAKDPMDPIDNAEPTEPIDSTEFFEAMLRIEPVEPMLQREVGSAMSSSSSRSNAFLDEGPADIACLGMR
ncbi:MAG: hypothetical protein RL134_1893 [Actinomycetota bacterium]